jgi:YebC/PmpR family DNA-binding regulatory protein
MAGHSHSANIARRKGTVDAQRARAFSKCAKIIQSAVRVGGPDPAANLRLRYALEKARASNMPKDSIERLLKKASSEGAAMEELVYEGYASGGVALLVTCLTDNRARTAPDIKHVFEKKGGHLGSPGSVGYLFRQRSILVVERGARSEEALMEAALAAGADDLQVSGEAATISAAPQDFLDVKTVLEKQGFAFLSAEIGYVPGTLVSVTSKADAARILGLIEALEANDDVQSVYANYDMPEAWIAELSSAS